MSKKNRKHSGFPKIGGAGHMGQQAQIQVSINYADALQRWKYVDNSELIAQIEAKRGSRVVCLVYSDAPAPAILAMPALQPFENVLLEIGKVSKIDLFLRSTGGVAEVPWRVVTLLREFCDELGVIVPRFALSGATHIAIAADDLVLTAFSVLGSVDPIRQHPLLPKDQDGKPIPMSVQDLKHCMDFVRQQLGESYAAQNLALVISELFKYVDPLAIGAIEQTYALSRLITEKVLKSRRTPLPDDQIKKIQDKLGGGYYSHAFLISRNDVEKDLGLPVTRPDTELNGLINQLDGYYNGEFTKMVQATPNATQPIFKAGGFVQSRQQAWVIGQVWKDNQLLADPWLEIPRQR